MALRDALHATLHKVRAGIFPRAPRGVEPLGKAFLKAEDLPTNIGRRSMTGIAEVHRRSLDHPEEFWAEAAEAIDWERRWDRVLDDSNPPFYRWFAGARLNTCWNALDRHVAAGKGDRVALIYEAPSPTPSPRSPIASCATASRASPGRWPGSVW
jgi:hypothetical protein